MSMLATFALANPTNAYGEETLLPLEQVRWVSPDRLSGAPCFTGSRVPIKALFDYLEGGDSLDTFVDDFEGVTRSQAISALYYGKAQLMPPGSPQPTGKSPHGSRAGICVKILFDHCVPRPLRRYFTGHQVETTGQNGWADLSNGKLLDAAEQAGFEVLLTVDGNLTYQQNLSGRSIRLVVLEALSNRVPTLAPLVPRVMERLPLLAPGAVERIQAEPSEREWDD